MPAAAVIPAPIAYIKVVAVKKLVVGSVSGRCRTTLAARRVAVSVASEDHASLRRGRRRAHAGRFGVLVTGTSAGRIVGRRTRVRVLGASLDHASARPSGIRDGGRLLQSCCAVLFIECRRWADTFTLNKLECSKQAQIWRGGLTAVPPKSPEYWSHGIMEQDLGPAHLRPSRARETALRGVSVHGPVGPREDNNSRSSRRVGFGTGGNDQQRRAGAFVPRR